MRWCPLLLAIAVLAGCGAQARRPAQPKLPRALANTWRAQADGVAAALASNDGCLALQRAAALRTSVIGAVNRRRVASPFQETLLGAVNDLASRIHCVAPVAPAPAPAHEGHGGHEHHGKGEHHGKHEGHGKKEKHKK